MAEMSKPEEPEAAFHAELRLIVRALDPASGWYAAFAARAPEELAAWLSGRVLPPWDVVTDLLHDFSARHGTGAAEPRARSLRHWYDAALRDEDRRPDARELLLRQRARAERERREAVRQEQQLAEAARQAGTDGRHREAERFAALRLWARDDEHRARARLAELEQRIAALPAPRLRAVPGTGNPAASGSAGSAGSAGGGTRARSAKKARPRGARFAGAAEEAPAPPAPRPVPAPAAPDRPGGARPTGSRFAGAAPESPLRPRPEPPGEEDRRLAAELTARLVRLRREGSGGQFYAALCEVLGGPGRRLPLVLDGMAGAGLEPEIDTLLWEAAALPVDRLAAVAESLAAAGRARECGRLLRQSAARPAGEAGTIAAELTNAGLAAEAVTLLTAVVRSKTAQEAVGAALDAPSVVTPLLLDAARQVSPLHHHALTTELRRAGVA
ncbi:hypothetical protein [Streptomyces aidingensis]|uniref:UL36 very large tegument protein n=1 Tax=Streptomyces aidingensis TaxID=910347 RepID=A0A1I1IVG9_9ACTN|nr:hypothetical protein [Streptomyces aidingensis]SFC40267.1 hypothetical protein SAMN05421773_103200 [Streptomyces aidingensis]